MKENIFKKSFNEYALPMIVRSIFTSVMHTADRTIAAIFIGSSALVATTLISPILYLIYAVSALLIGGLGAYIGLLIGKDEVNKAKSTASSIIILLGVVGVIILTVTILFSENISIFLGARGETVHTATTYLTVIAISFPIMLVARGIDALIYNDGNPQYSFKLNIIVTILNLILNIITVVVFNLGIFGLALATVISEFVMLIGTSYFYFFKAKTLKFATPKFSIKTIARIAYNGLSDFAMLFADSVMIFVLNIAFIKFLTPAHFEGYAVANVLFFLFYGVFMGSSMGLQPIYSQLMGKKDYAKLKPMLSYSIRKTVILSICMYLISIPIASIVLKLFTNDPDVLKYAKFFYMTIGFSIMFSNLPLQTSSFFTAINRPIESVVISLTRTIVLIPGLAYFSIILIGETGVAIGYLLADVILILLIITYMKNIDVSKLKIYD